MNAHPDIIKIANHLYTNYCIAVGGVAFNGDVLPDWETFSKDSNKKKQADAWIATANCARNYFEGPQ